MHTAVVESEEKVKWATESFAMKYVYRLDGRANS